MKTVVSTLLALSLSLLAQVASADFRDNGDGTVTDLRSKLVWQQCSAPSGGTNCSSGTPATYIWDNALSYCNGLSVGGSTDWRLPNVKELQSIVDVAKASDPTIDVTYFPNTQPGDYWTSTTAASSTIYAWYVRFKIGYWMTSAADKPSGQYVRCVRGG